MSDQPRAGSDARREDGPDHWTVRLIVEMQVSGPRLAENAAKFAGESMAMGALGWDDADCQVFAVNDGKETGPFYRTSAYRKAYGKARGHWEDDDV